MVHHYDNMLWLGLNSGQVHITESVNNLLKYRSRVFVILLKKKKKCTGIKFFQHQIMTSSQLFLNTIKKICFFFFFWFFFFGRGDGWGGGGGGVVEVLLYLIRCNVYY